MREQEIFSVEEGLKKYGDMLNMPHPVSKKHPPMDEMSRAAQFAPFAALTGYEEAIEEKMRKTLKEREQGGVTREENNIEC